ncbi:hypothetical protein U9M48_006615 [Paspalum notatum var. saurae]|uniref:Pentatricopeptide repeat-containing protein n=1 Tax=Paspalum notatum var. saurae TaxID=547442 RepID=A0AAQ3SMB4_PASNO
MINAYARCGDARMALRAFDEVPEKGLGAARRTPWGPWPVNGRCREALLLLSLMLRRGARPDGAVFLALLSACCHAGRAGGPGAAVPERHEEGVRDRAGEGA